MGEIPSGYIINRSSDVRSIARDYDRKIRLGQAPTILNSKEKLGFRLRMARLESGLTQEVLAGLASISRFQLCRIERGRSNPSARTLHEILRALQKAQLQRNIGEAEKIMRARKRRKIKPPKSEPSLNAFQKGLLEMYLIQKKWQEDFDAWAENPQGREQPIPDLPKKKRPK
jgi:transcriptional regulator with XRE-family HTH domain